MSTSNALGAANKSGERMSTGKKVVGDPTSRAAHLNGAYLALLEDQRGAGGTRHRAVADTLPAASVATS